jgi:hypothetical protein
MTLTLPVVLFQAPHEKKSVERLVRFCRDLDGTEVRVFTAPEPEGMRYPENANWSFRHVAEQMKGQAFIWIEADCAPLKAGWAKAISDEYVRLNKEYLYAGHMNPPFDNFSGVGVQGPNAFEHAPVGFKSGGFDEFIICAHPDKVGRTELIRHSYGLYESNGDVTLHEFPRDMYIIGNEAVLFHKDQRNQLLDIVLPDRGFHNTVKAVSGVGDIGDLTVSLATIYHQGDQAEYYLRDNGMTAGIVRRIHLVKPLVEAQPYIDACKIWKRETIHWESEGFRPSWHDRAKPLAESHAQHAVDTGFIPSLPDLSKQWLFADKNKAFEGRIIINRTDRYLNHFFPWANIVSHYGKRLVFIGMPYEHQSFCEAFGHVEYHPTRDMLEAAQIIAASQLYIGNQSSCMTIAEGLKHPRIQEGCLRVSDCVYPGSDNAQYVFDGSVILPDIDGSGELIIPSQAIRWQDFDINVVPKVGGNWGWHYKHGDMMIVESIVSVAARRLSRLTGWDLDKCSSEIVKYTVNSAPGFFAGRINLSQFDNCKRAVQHAGLNNHPILEIGRGKFKIR